MKQTKIKAWAVVWDDGILYRVYLYKIEAKRAIENYAENAKDFMSVIPVLITLLPQKSKTKKKKTNPS